MEKKWLLLMISAALFIAFSYLVWNTSGLMFSIPFSALLLLSASNPRWAGMIFYFFIGFLAGFVVALIIGVETNATGWKSGALMILPFIGAFLALYYGKKSNYLSWPVFGFRYKL
ncbi:hypothetical protein [Thermococcus gorgonarius]|uniref:Uncharacterized protein n=1 Tax=Thermococcus gorgonarius TaxID=71997 RepID=A0A2Z2M8J2_THEGO|nr:hypothetical protein [Thermococcus gorgonarius]ASJ00194.1 hypothetical protein A3K92_01195 [Thermococcus gorgonarius]